MSKVKRFNSEFRGMIERPNGQFVFASEYEKVQAQLLASQAEAAELSRRYENRNPTEWAYGQACSALEKHRARADAAEAKLDYFGTLVSKARISADKAMVKFTQPNYVLLKVAEEAGEVVQAGVHYAEGRMKWGQLEGEVVQLLAMLIRLVTEGDQVNGVTPPESCRDFKPAPAADLAELVPDAKAIRKEAGGYAPVYSLQEQQLFIDGATWLRAAILSNIEGAEAGTNTADLAQLVPDEISYKDIDCHLSDFGRAISAQGWNDCRAAILRNIEEASKKHE